jgi:RNA polymerase sigma-70 factor (ECF subfamily)
LDSSDEELMTAYGKQGDVKAFEILLDRYRWRIMGYLINSVRDRAIAEELYQETFLRVIRSAAAYRPKASFQTWIFTIARRLVIDTHRKRTAHAPMLSLNNEDDDTRAFEEPPADPSGSRPDHHLHRSEIRRALKEALENMPPEQREMFLLREFSGLDFKTAARIAGCSVNTAKSRMRYALLKLRDEFRSRNLDPEQTRMKT